MFRKLIPTLAICITFSNANDAFIALKYGLTSLNQDGIDLHNNSYEIDLTINQNFLIYPRLGLSYISIDEKGESVSALTQLGFEGVYDLQIGSDIVPYLFGGLGYENVSNSREGFDSQFFLDGGIGARYPLTDTISLLTELKTLYILGGNDQDSELAWYIGIGSSLGTSYDVPKDSDGDGVFDYQDQCPNTPYQATVDAAGCPISYKEDTNLIDSDGDGVYDKDDKCPNTPPESAVDINGCPVKIIKIKKSKPVPKKIKKVTTKTLEVHFEPNSAQITFDSKPKLSQFADYIKKYPDAKVEIVGYTDSSGDRNKNQILSLQRAQSVKRLLVRYGVPSHRIKAIGKGELNPIAPNDTPEGRAKNRRIEVTIKW